MKVLLLGATGLVGSHCITEILNHPQVESLILAVRQTPQNLPQDPRIVVQKVDFTRLADYASTFVCDAVICCLGTTRRQAGSRREFERIDVTLPLMAAALAYKQGARCLGLVSAMGANTHSFAFYNRCKGMLEKGLQMIGYPSLTIARPSLLLGNRLENRPLERIAQKISALAQNWIPLFWRPVGAQQVARALVAQTLKQEPGVQILYNRTLWNTP